MLISSNTLKRIVITRPAVLPLQQHRAADDLQHRERRGRTASSDDAEAARPSPARPRPGRWREAPAHGAERAERTAAMNARIADPEGAERDVQPGGDADVGIDGHAGSSLRGGTPAAALPRILATPARPNASLQMTNPRIAIVSDIHGNLPALEAVWAEIERAAPALVVNLGDIASGPLWPRETVQWLMAREAAEPARWRTIAGNHERQALAADVARMGASDAYAARALGAPERAWLAALPGHAVARRRRAAVPRHAGQRPGLFHGDGHPRLRRRRPARRARGQRHRAERTRRRDAAPATRAPAWPPR